MFSFFSFFTFFLHMWTGSIVVVFLMGRWTKFCSAPFPKYHLLMHFKRIQLSPISKGNWHSTMHISLGRKDHNYCSSPGEDVRSGGGDLHGVLGSLPHLLHPLLPLPPYHSQGVDLKCLPGGEALNKYFGSKIGPIGPFSLSSVVWQQLQSYLTKVYGECRVWWILFHYS